MAYALLDEVQALLDTDGPLDLERVGQTQARIEANPPTTRADRDALLVQLEALTARTRAELTEVGGHLRKVGAGRRALRGYGHLKATKDAQHANKTA